MVKSAGLVAGEGAFVGVVLIIFIYIAAYLLRVGGYPTIATPEECKKWNNTYIMEATAFLAGVLFHVSFEYLGINEHYAKNYFS